MNSTLADLEPKEIWKHFDALCAIPRASTNEAEARRYVLSVASKAGLEAVQDTVGNVVIRKLARAGRESAPIAALQGHLDMVCEKNEGTAHDFGKDPIRVVRNGDWLMADGTTLGADNGVGVAAALAVLESKDINHGPLEFIFTIDEETGLTGASEFGLGLLKSKYLLNLDGEEKDTLCIGCSGGLNTTARRTAKFHPASGTAAWRIKVSGLKGGHSGVDIHLGRGNALRVLGCVLQRLLDRFPIEIADVAGGSARNAIPRESSAVVVGNESLADELKAVVAAVETETRLDLGSFDSGLLIKVEGADRPATVLDAASARSAVDVLVGLPHGVLAMSPDVPGLVQNSTNLAIVSVRGDQIEFGTSQRSAIESSKQATARMVATVFRMAGFEVEHGGGYPGWKPEPTSEIVRKLQGVHETVFGKPAGLVAMHAGLECGVIGEKYPGMQLISFGPQIENPHSPNERVEIPSVAAFWKYLRAVLEGI